MPTLLRWSLRAIVLAQIALVSWDTLALMEPYGFRRAQFDGIEYLTMAHSLLRGEALRATPVLEPQPYRWVKDWPLGYPALIAITSTLTDTEPFYISRWVNVACYIASYLLLLWITGPLAEILFLALWPPNLSWSVGFVLSENLFTCLFVASVGMAQYFFRYSRSYWVGFSLALLLVGLFLTRYTGIAVGAAVGLTGMWLLFQKRFREGIYWLVSAALQGIFAITYFYWNWKNDPTSGSGLKIREMPVPPDFFAYVFEELGFVYYALGIITVALLMKYFFPKRLPTVPALPFAVKVFLAFSFLTHLIVYVASMLAGRVGLTEVRHLWVVFLPILWISWDEVLRRLPVYVYVFIGLGFLFWQIRNTHRHFEWAMTGPHLPYSYAYTVARAYDTLPPHTCISGGSAVYAMLGQRKDLTLVGRASYWTVLFRRCSCIYVDGGLVTLRAEVEPFGTPSWPFVRWYSDTCAGDTICLAKVACTNSR